MEENTKMSYVGATLVIAHGLLYQIIEKRTPAFVALSQPQPRLCSSWDFGEKRTVKAVQVGRHRCERMKYARRQIPANLIR